MSTRLPAGQSESIGKELAYVRRKKGPVRAGRALGRVPAFGAQKGRKNCGHVGVWGVGTRGGLGGNFTFLTILTHVREPKS